MELLFFFLGLFVFGHLFGRLIGAVLTYRTPEQRHADEKRINAENRHEAWMREHCPTLYRYNRRLP